MALTRSTMSINGNTFFESAFCIPRRIIHERERNSARLVGLTINENLPLSPNRQEEERLEVSTTKSNSKKA